MLRSFDGITLVNSCNDSNIIILGAYGFNKFTDMDGTAFSAPVGDTRIGANVEYFFLWFILGRFLFNNVLLNKDLTV